jgi:hypothetical protein
MSKDTVPGMLFESDCQRQKFRDWRRFQALNVLMKSRGEAAQWAERCFIMPKREGSIRTVGAAAGRKSTRDAVTVVSGVVDELIIERDAGEAEYSNAVVCLQDLLGAGIRQLAVADNSAQTASGEIQFALMENSVDGTRQTHGVVRSTPARAGQRDSPRHRLVDVGEIKLLHGTLRHAGASEDAKVAGELLFGI